MSGIASKPPGEIAPVSPGGGFSTNNVRIMEAKLYASWTS